MQFIKEKGARLTGFLAEILIGVLLIVEPVRFTSAVIIAAGVIICIVGVLNIIRYLKADPAAAAVSGTLYKGISLCLAGLFCALRSGWFVATFPIISMIYGVCILLAGIKKVQWTVDAVRLKTGSWIAYAVSAFVTVVCAAIILINPFGSIKVLWYFIGISLIAEAVMDIVSMVIKGKEPVTAPVIIETEGDPADETQA